MSRFQSLTAGRKKKTAFFETALRAVLIDKFSVGWPRVRLFSLLNFPTELL
jgi:hypothetical protein